MMEAEGWAQIRLNLIGRICIIQLRSVVYPYGGVWVSPAAEGARMTSFVGRAGSIVAKLTRRSDELRPHNHAFGPLSRPSLLRL